MVSTNQSDSAARGTWGSSEAAAEWQRGVATRLRLFGPATERLLDLACIRAGNRVLDIGAGSGDQTLGATRRVGMTGTVLATDISPSMVELTAMAARQASLPNIHTQMMDAQQLELPADSFDVVISRFALMLIPDIHKALSEIRRVLRSGGTLAALVYSKCPYLSIPQAIVRRVGGLTWPPEPFGEFRLAEARVMSTRTGTRAFSRSSFTRFQRAAASLRLRQRCNMRGTLPCR